MGRTFFKQPFFDSIRLPHSNGVCRESFKALNDFGAAFLLAHTSVYNMIVLPTAVHLKQLMDHQCPH